MNLVFKISDSTRRTLQYEHFKSIRLSPTKVLCLGRSNVSWLSLRSLPGVPLVFDKPPFDHIISLSPSLLASCSLKVNPALTHDCKNQSSTVMILMVFVARRWCGRGGLGRACAPGAITHGWEQLRVTTESAEKKKHLRTSVLLRNVHLHLIGSELLHSHRNIFQSKLFPFSLGNLCPSHPNVHTLPWHTLRYCGGDLLTVWYQMKRPRNQLKQHRWCFLRNEPFFPTV